MAKRRELDPDIAAWYARQEALMQGPPPGYNKQEAQAYKHFYNPPQTPEMVAGRFKNKQAYNRHQNALWMDAVDSGSTRFDADQPQFDYIPEEVKMAEGARVKRGLAKARMRMSGMTRSLLSMAPVLDIVSAFLEAHDVKKRGGGTRQFLNNMLGAAAEQPPRMA